VEVVVLNAVESFVKRAVPARTLATGTFTVLAFDDRESDDTIVYTPLVLDQPDWYGAAQRARKATEPIRSNAAFSAELRFDRQRLYLPLVSFREDAQGLAPGVVWNRHSEAFWKALHAEYRGKRLLVYRQGTRLCGFLEALLDPQERDDWLGFLGEHGEVVDPVWVRSAERYGFGGALGVVSVHHLEPKLDRWVNL
jgi:hypothetical protein